MEKRIENMMEDITTEDKINGLIDAIMAAQTERQGNIIFTEKGNELTVKLRDAYVELEGKTPGSLKDIADKFFQHKEAVRHEYKQLGIDHINLNENTAQAREADKDLIIQEALLKAKKQLEIE